MILSFYFFFFFFQAEDGIRDFHVTGVQTCALPILMRSLRRWFYAAALLALSSHDLHAEDVKTFYTGKTIKLLVGLPPGGGADAYARLVQRHLGRFVPGAPQIVA